MDLRKGGIDRWGDPDDVLNRYEELLTRLRRSHAQVRDVLIPLVDRISPPGLRQPLAMMVEFHYRTSVFVASAGLPLRMLHNAVDWSSLHAAASAAVEHHAGTVSQLDDWRGVAAETYRWIVPAQTAATRRVSDAAGGTAGALWWTGAAAAGIYIAVLALIVRTITAVLAALATAVVAPLAALPAIGTAAATALGGLSAIEPPARQAIAHARDAMAGVEAQLGDATTFPRGRWPRPQSKRWQDATVTDGDADWSLRR